jgi:SAM-dependent methyltransferase
MSIASTLKYLWSAGWRTLGGQTRTVSDLKVRLDYEAAYEALARQLPPEQAIGVAETTNWYDACGLIELGLLQMEGLRPTDTPVDFGCGNGRLALKAVPALKGGAYIGIDISDTMLREADRLVRKRIPHPSCSVRWIKQTGPAFPLPDASVDRMCAFSVFSHMEHEDTFRYLTDARRVIKPDGGFVFSCLHIRLALAREVFRHQASHDLKTRWRGVRNVVTTAELMETIARMAGWEPLRWYPADKACIHLPSSDEWAGLGQEACALKPAAT